MSKQNFSEFESEQVQSIKPLQMKHQEQIEKNRIVLYREDFREIMPVEYSINKIHKPKNYIIEVSRSRYRLYIIAIKIPKKH